MAATNLYSAFENSHDQTAATQNTGRPSPSRGCDNVTASADLDARKLQNSRYRNARKLADKLNPMCVRNDNQESRT